MTKETMKKRGLISRKAPACFGKWGDTQETKVIANQLRAELQDKLTPQEIEAAQSQALAETLETAVAEVLKQAELE